MINGCGHSNGGCGFYNYGMLGVSPCLEGVLLEVGTEAESDIPVHVRVHVHEGKISGRGLRYQGVVRVWSQDGGS